MQWPHAETAVITGAASGIGSAIAVALAGEGWKVGIADINEDGAANTLEKVKEAGGTGEIYNCDVGKLEDVQAMADHFFDSWGKVGLLVNNVGIGGGGPIGATPIEDWKLVVETNYWSVIYGCHAFVPRMKTQGGGHILNTASGAGLVSTAEMAPYCSTKAAVVALSQTLKVELAPYNIGVTVLCPSCVSTDIVKHTLERTGFEEYSDGWGMEFMRVAWSKTNITPEYEAARVLKALERNKLYIKPRAPGFALSVLNARISPEIYYQMWAYLNKKGFAKPIYMKMAQMGWI